LAFPFSLPDPLPICRFPPRASARLPLADVPSSRSYRPRNIGHGETTAVTTRPWWRVLVGRKIGSSGSVVFWVPREVHAVSTPTRWRMWVLTSFLKGVGDNSSPPSVPCRGKHYEPSPLLIVGGVAWYALQSARSVVEILRMRTG
jgi:hypothetical protein